MLDYDNTGPQGFTRPEGTHEYGAEVDDELVDDEMAKSEEPEDGEDLEENLDK